MRREGGGDWERGRRLLLDLELGEALQLRARRALAQSAVDLQALTVPGEVLDPIGVASRGRARAGLQRLAGERHLGAVCLAPLLERWATLEICALGWGEMRTRIPEVHVDGRLARSVLVMVGHMILVLADGAEVAPCLEVCVERRGRALSLRASLLGHPGRPVPSAAGAEALQQLRRLVRIMGGTVTREVDARDARLAVDLGPRARSASARIDDR
jgi:hypothetical protein